MTTTKRTYVIVRRGHKLIRADYAGGPYIELTFGSATYRPTEVINVWDDATNKPDIADTDAAVRAEVLRWVAVQDVEWPEWYDGYLENAGYR